MDHVDVSRVLQCCRQSGALNVHHVPVIHVQLKVSGLGKDIYERASKHKGGYSHREDRKRERPVVLAFRYRLPPFRKVEPDDLGGHDPDRESVGEADRDGGLCVDVRDCCCRPPDCGWEQEVCDSIGVCNGTGVERWSSGVLSTVTESVSRGAAVTFGMFVVAGVLRAVVEPEAEGTVISMLL